MLTTSNPTPSGGGTGAESGSASNIRAVLFDLDGTLIDTTELILTSFRYATRQVLGEAVPDDVLLSDIGTPLSTQMSKISPEHGEELVRVYREHNNVHHDELASEFPGVESTLRALKERGYPVGVVTSKLNAGALRGLKLFGLDSYIDFIVGSDDVSIHKPDPFPLYHAAGLMRIPLEACVYVGDSPHDMAAAVAGGAVGVAALWGPFETEVVLGPRPAYAIELPEDLLLVLSGRGEGFRVASRSAQSNG